MNKIEFKDAMKRYLGHGAVKIHVTDDQINDALTKALKFFYQYSDEATENVYYKYQITQNDINSGTNTITLPEEVYDVRKILPIRKATVGDYEYNLLVSMSPMNSNHISYASNNIGMYYMNMQNLSLIKSLFQHSPKMSYSKFTNRVRLDITLGKDLALDDFIIFDVVKLVDPDIFERLYEDNNFLALASEYLRRIQSINLSKFANVSLPGGVKFDYEKMAKEATDNIKIYEKVIKEYYAPVCPIMLM